jgi:hypothetical protein
MVYPPSNFMVTGAGAIATSGSVAASLPANDTCTLDTDGGTFACTASSSFYVPVMTAVAQTGGPDAVVFAYASLTIPATTTVTVEGSKVLMLYVLGAVDVEGTLTTDGNGSVPNSPGNGGDNFNQQDLTGGAGGSFCGTGGDGGNVVSGGGGYAGTT